VFLASLPFVWLLPNVKGGQKAEVAALD